MDPGTDTGLVCWEGEYRRHPASEVKNGLIWAIEVPGAEGAGGWLRASEKIACKVLEAQCDVFLYEDFILHGGSHSSEREGLDPVRVTCGVQILLKVGKWSGTQVAFLPSISAVYHDIRMRKWGLWLQGRGDYSGYDGHATSAARGLVWFLRDYI